MSSVIEVEGPIKNQESLMSRYRALSHKAEPSARGPRRFIGSLEKVPAGRCWAESYYSALICFLREIQDGKTKCSFGNKLGCALI